VLNLATEYTEITEKTIKIFRAFRVFRGYLDDISLSQCHSVLVEIALLFTVRGFPHTLHNPGETAT
jgi:hypothetical protein